MVYGGVFVRPYTIFLCVNYLIITFSTLLPWRLIYKPVDTLLAFTFTPLRL